jgi:DNA excision repair protein ERCC-4
VWHQLSWRTKQLVSDMKTLRYILTHLTNYDCITFYSFVSALQTTENAIRSGGWMILDSAETLFISAKSRVFGPDSSSSTSEASSEGGTATKKAKFDFEESPKWQVLTDILAEIKEEVKENCKDDENPFPSIKVLVLTADERVSEQIQVRKQLKIFKHSIFLKPKTTMKILPVLTREPYSCLLH